MARPDATIVHASGTAGKSTCCVYEALPLEAHLKNDNYDGSDDLVIGELLAVQLANG